MDEGKKTAVINRGHEWNNMTDIQNDLWLDVSHPAGDRQTICNEDEIGRLKLEKYERFNLWAKTVVHLMNFEGQHYKVTSSVEYLLILKHLFNFIQ